ncbi:hypothetical protein [Lysobacter silvisoli]|uniref:Uncharacterized protein n=1 Tax=Lysobacter silvisoli TaxID=2293254 RepID=A0A371JZ10_9GAMM|nr:hypothetical protein [Lysobacter silvisoli]RDZ26908.1 hypothetical protein DX914_11570 [Lysobacter silvisoli]
MSWPVRLSCIAAALALVLAAGNGALDAAGPAMADGAAGRFALPIGFDADAPQLEVAGNGRRSSQALRSVRDGQPGDALLLQMCVSAPPDLRTEQGLQALMTGVAPVLTQRDSSPGSWETLGGRRAYRMDSVLGPELARTMWMVLSGEKMAVLRYERPVGFGLDAAMFEAIKRMEFSCGTAP